MLLSHFLQVYSLNPSETECSVSSHLTLEPLRHPGSRMPSEDELKAWTEFGGTVEEKKRGDGKRVDKTYVYEGKQLRSWKQASDLMAGKDVPGELLASWPLHPPEAV